MRPRWSDHVCIWLRNRKMSSNRMEIVDAGWLSTEDTLNCVEFIFLPETYIAKLKISNPSISSTTVFKFLSKWLSILRLLLPPSVSPPVVIWNGCGELLNSHTRKPVPAGGVFGYLRTRSTPSLIAGLGLGTSYALSGKHKMNCALHIPVCAIQCTNLTNYQVTWSRKTRTLEPSLLWETAFFFWALQSQESLRRGQGPLCH